MKNNGQEEFENLCQVDSPESPKLKEEAIETNSPMDSIGPVVVTNNTESPAPLPPPPLMKYQCTVALPLLVALHLRWVIAMS